MLPPGLGFRNGADDLYLDAEPNTKPRPKWETLSKLSNVGFSFYLIGFYGYFAVNLSLEQRKFKNSHWKH